MFYKKKFSDLKRDAICGDMAMVESNTVSKFLILADGDISVAPMPGVVPERRNIRRGGEAIRNSVWTPRVVNLSLFLVIQFWISATQL